MMRTVPCLRPFSWAFTLSAAALLLLSVGGCGGNGDGDTRPSSAPVDDGIVATVDGSQVRAGEALLVRAERRLMGEDEAASTALDEAIERALMRREAERLGVRADEGSVAERLAELESTFGGAAALDDVLRRAGMSRSQLRQSVTDGVLREALRDAKFSGTRVTGRALETYYRRNLDRLFTRPASTHLGAIQVRTDKVAENAIDRLAQGRPFTEVARQFSMDPESRDNGGDLGWVLTSSLPPAVRKAVETSRPGLITRPVGGGTMWYVLNVLGVRRAQVTPLDEVRSRLAAQLTRVKRAKALERWLDQAREQATIVVP
jgi:parvulin-like peptidyl-prolyl isomerase